ncbi:Protein of unknown function [Pyronema omphalodes CBS 100304]|uniref:Uncharacterized protein n=1 Tax=Pyronema omphalodes (strain CBS 100304) TaxID=1076935 RepID=U4L4S9_PYROM|nr:Protein of unknown function [Pyronema omphalodes CBS 100304]
MPFDHKVFTAVLSTEAYLPTASHISTPRVAHPQPRATKSTAAAM